MIIVLMGVAGAGKTLVGRALAHELAWTFVDADDLHSPSNVWKMRSGISLSDADREPWLAAVRERLLDADSRGRDVVLACSALGRGFRERLREGLSRMELVYLKVDRASIESRLRERADHFFDPRLASSQFDALEEPRDAIVIDATMRPEKIVEAILRELDDGR